MYKSLFWLLLVFMSIKLPSPAVTGIPQPNRPGGLYGDLRIIPHYIHIYYVPEHTSRPQLFPLTIFAI